MSVCSTSRMTAVLENIDIPEALFIGKRPRRSGGRAATEPPCRFRCRAATARPRGNRPHVPLTIPNVAAWDEASRTAITRYSKSLACSSKGSETLESTESSLNEYHLVSTADSNLAVWPSLRQSATGWDFCSDASEHSWVDTHDLEACETIEVAPQEESVVAKDGQRSSTAAVRPSLAELLSQQQETLRYAGGVQPPAHGYQLPSKTHRCRRPKKVNVEAYGVANDEFNPSGLSRKWKKQHKASWNARTQRKVAEQSAKRAEQRQRSLAVDVD